MKGIENNLIRRSGVLRIKHQQQSRNTTSLYMLLRVDKLSQSTANMLKISVAVYHAHSFTRIINLQQIKYPLFGNISGDLT